MGDASSLQSDKAAYVRHVLAAALRVSPESAVARSVANAFLEFDNSLMTEPDFFFTLDVAACSAAAHAEWAHASTGEHVRDLLQQWPQEARTELFFQTARR